MRRLALILAAVCAAAPAAGTPHDGAGAAADVSATSRTQLTRPFLLGATRLAKPVPLAAFAPPAGAPEPAFSFQGRLTFTVRPSAAKFRLLRDDLKYAAGGDRSYRVPPPFDFTFVQAGEHLVPSRRGPQPGAHDWWEWSVEPGRVWLEPGDGGLARAAVPFALIERNANCTHNGVLTFLFGASGEVSRVAYQISQETCQYFKFDAWGVAAASWHRETVPAGAELAAAFERERAARLPVRPIEALPEVDATRVGSAAEVSAEHMTAYGLVVDGVHYVGGCETRHGGYPFCDGLLLPSYSIAKSVFAGLALMRLELEFPGARSASIADYVPECAAAGGWEGVTFDHALDMATGRYDSTESEADENASIAHPFFVVATHAEKIRLACARYARKEPPGRRWVYHTTDTYVLGTAMAQFWRRRREGSDLFDELLVSPVFEPLALSPTVAAARRTYDEPRQPFTGWGLTLLRDDVAKLGAFLTAGRGRIAGEPVVSPRELKSALQRRADDRGLEAGGEEFRYNNGFWAWNAARTLGCAKPTWLPFMSGFGGISVVLLPNDIVYYYFSDHGEYRWASSVAQADRLRPFCERAP